MPYTNNIFIIPFLNLCVSFEAFRSTKSDVTIAVWVSKVLKYINERLIRWVMRKYKRFSKGKKFSKAYEWLVEYAAHNRNEFLHWVKGFVPYPRLG